MTDSELSQTAILQTSSQPFKDMSFPYVNHQATMCSKKLCAPPLGYEAPWSDWNDNVRTVAAFEESIRQNLLMSLIPQIHSHVLRNFQQKISD